MGIFDQDGSQVATISSSSNGEVSMTLYDAKSGLARAGLGLSAKGTPALVLFDQDGKDRAELNLNAEGKPGLALADANGKTIAGLPMQSSPAQ
jgi:thioredoxin-related protein